MEKIKLTKDSKRILKALNDGIFKCERLTESEKASLRILSEEGLVVLSGGINDSIISASLSDSGKAYIAEYPKLKNPGIFEDTKTKYIINLVISIIALIISVIALFK